MNGHRSPRDGARLVAVAVAISLALAACGGTTSPSPAGGSAAPAVASPSSATPATAPSPTPAATPSPTASPKVDVAAVAAAALTSPSFSGKATVTGSLAQGAIQGDITGSAAFAPNASSLAMTIAIGTARLVSESRSVGSASYSRSGSGPWFAVAPGDQSRDLRDVLGSLRDDGLVTVNGESLHRLVSTTPVTPTDLGLGSMSSRDGTAAVEVLASDTGEPRVMVLQADWTSQDAAGGTVPGSIRLEITFSCTGCAVTIAEPDEVFTAFQSAKLGYSLALPHDWDAQLAAKAAEPDWFFSPDDRMVGGFRYTTSLTLNQYAKEFIAYAKAGGGGAYKKFVLVDSTATEVTGRKAMRVTYHAVISGQRQYVIAYFVKVGGKMYEFDLVAAPGHEAEDDAFMELVRPTISLD